MLQIIKVGGKGEKGKLLLIPLYRDNSNKTIILILVGIEKNLEIAFMQN
jgi:hypothetical protein